MTHFNGVSSPLEIGQILLRPNGRTNLVGYSAAHGGLGILRAVVSQQNTEIATYTLAGRVLNASGVGVAGVTVNLSGTQSGSKVTDASGNYSFAGLPMGGNFTVTPSKAGLSFVPASKSFTNLSADQLSGQLRSPLALRQQHHRDGRQHRRDDRHLHRQADTCSHCCPSRSSTRPPTRRPSPPETTRRSR